MTDFGSPAASQSTEINAVELHQREPCKRRRTQTFIQTRCGDARFQAVFCLFILFSQRSHSFSASRLVPLPFMRGVFMCCHFLCPVYDFLLSPKPSNRFDLSLSSLFLSLSCTSRPPTLPPICTREKKAERKKKKRQNELEV